jgi:hypothetical protein
MSADQSVTVEMAPGGRLGQLALSPQAMRHEPDRLVEQFPGPAQIEHLENPRVEAPEHYYYNVVHTGLEKLGHRVDVDKLYPGVQWTATNNT